MRGNLLDRLFECRCHVCRSQSHCLNFRTLSFNSCTCLAQCVWLLLLSTQPFSDLALQPFYVSLPAPCLSSYRWWTQPMQLSKACRSWSQSALPCKLRTSSCEVWSGAWKCKSASCRQMSRHVAALWTAWKAPSARLRDLWTVAGTGPQSQVTFAAYCDV